MENIERPARRAGNRAFQPVERRPMGERQPVDERQMPQALPEVLIAGLFRVHQLRHGAAAAEIRHQPWPFPASPRSKRKVSATSHGPKALPTPPPAPPPAPLRQTTNTPK